MNPFAEKYKTLSNSQLIDIIDTPENYQPTAITAAEDELLARNLSIADMTAARAENEIAANERAAKTERKKAFEDKLVNAAGKVVETISPVQKTPPSVNRVILLISIVFGVYGLLAVYHFADFLVDMWRISFHVRVSIMMPYFFEGFYLLGMAFMFWKRMKWGWVFLVIYLSFSVTGAFVNIVTEVARREVVLPGHHVDFYTLSPVSMLFSLLFYACCTWYVYKPGIRELYRVDKYLGIITAAAGVFLALLVFALIAGRVY